MFENLTNKFEEIFSSLKKAPSLNEKQVEEGLRSIRQALLEADVALPVAKTLMLLIYFDIWNKIKLESNPPDNNTPNGTSAINLFSTAFVNELLINSQYLVSSSLEA
jgi:signal recognition particle GTPase